MSWIVVLTIFLSAINIVVGVTILITMRAVKNRTEKPRKTLSNDFSDFF